jgi:hypothetical protein
VNLNGVLGFVSAVDLRFTLERKEFEEVDTPALNAGLGSVFAVKADTAALVADNCVCVCSLSLCCSCLCLLSCRWGHELSSYYIAQTNNRLSAVREVRVGASGARVASLRS